MSKRLIEQALLDAIERYGLHRIALDGGNEDAFTINLGDSILNCDAQVKFRNPFGGYERIDNITYKDAARNNIAWALEAKHFTPHQRTTLLDYLHWSVGGCVKDILKLIDCGFEKFYIVQLQTQINQCDLLGVIPYDMLFNEFPLVRRYLNNGNNALANTNIQRVLNQHRIPSLVDYSQQRLDTNLLRDHIVKLISTPFANIVVTIHYLISGPFYREILLQQLTDTNQGVLDFSHALENQVGGKNQIPTWEVNISIESDPNA